MILAPDINIQSYLLIHLQLLSTEQTVVSPPVLSTVVNKVRRSEPVVHNRRPLC